MKTAQGIARALRVAKDEQRVSAAELQRRTGLTAVSVRAALSGATDPRLSTLMALAHELDLDLVLVPKTVSASMAVAATPLPQIKTLIDAIRERNSG